MDDIAFVWALACCLVGGFTIGTWAMRGLQRLFRPRQSRVWPPEDILTREG